MSTYLFQLIARNAQTAGVGPADTQAARDWYRQAARRVAEVNVNKLQDSNKSRLFSRFSREDIGSMISFFYDAKLKNELPYWDQFPLVFPMEIYDDGFLGINMHYLPPMLRARLMDALYNTAITKKSQIQRLKISYDILASASKYTAFRPCIKRYLKNHVKSRFFYIEPREWDMALLLPTQRFVGATDQKVWRDSRAKIKKAGG
jgi:hypothetical protein